MRRVVWASVNQMTGPPLPIADTSGDPLVARDIFIARQSIYDAHLNVVGYEVLFRSGRDNRALVTDGDQATSRLLLNAVVEIGLSRVVGDRLAFVNLTREFLLGNHPLPLDSRQLVLEILEDVRIDDELVDGLAKLVARGYTLALDDAVFRDDLEPLLALASVVKVEVPAIPKGELADQVRRFRRHPVKLLAEKVETMEEFTRCRDLGFEYFQGFFLARPQMIPGKQVRASDIGVLNLLSRLADPDLGIDELERLIKGDASLSFKLLRFINSARFGLRTRIDSLRQVIVLLGADGVRTMAMLISLAGAVEKPGDVLKDAMQRAVLCERIAGLLGRTDTSTYFTAGLLSALDAVLDMPLEHVAASMQLSDRLRLAVLDRQGAIGGVLTAAVAIGRAEWDAIPAVGLTAEQITGAYLSTIEEVARLWTPVG
jgi:c-di-GMP phosphodiesterase